MNNLRMSAFWQLPVLLPVLVDFIDRQCRQCCQTNTSRLASTAGTCKAKIFYSTELAQLRVAQLCQRGYRSYID